MLIGQEKLKDWVARTEELPHFIVLAGPKGSGKTLMSKYIASAYDMDWYEVEGLKVANVRGVIENAQALSKTRLYHFENADTMTNAAQNALLKIAEEPPEKVFIILTVQNDINLLTTIRSRCRLLTMQPYTTQHILDVGVTQEIAEIAENIGQAYTLRENDFSHLYNLAETITTSIGHASLANVFKIGNKVEDTEYELFFSILLHHFDKQMKENYQTWQTKAVSILSEYRQLMDRTTVNSAKLMEMMFVEMWRLHRNELD